MVLRSLPLLFAGAMSCSLSTSQDAPQPHAADQASEENSSDKPGSVAEGAELAAAESPAEPAEPPPLKLAQTENGIDILYRSQADPPYVRFAVGEAHLFVVERTQSGTHRLLRLEKDRPEPQEILEAERIEDFDADNEHVYIQQGEQVQRVPIAGGEPQPVAQGAGELLVGPQHIILRDGNVYYRAPKGGGDLEQIGKTRRKAGFRTSVLVDGHVYALASGYRNLPGRLPKKAWLEAVPVKGGKVDHLRSFFEPGQQLVADAGKLYFSATLEKEKDAFDYDVMRLDPSRPHRMEPVVHHSLAVFDVEGDYLYAHAELEDNRGLHRFPLNEKDAGDPELMKLFADGANALRVDDTHVYWETRGVLFRLAKDVVAPAPEPAAEDDGDGSPAQSAGEDGAKQASGKAASDAPRGSGAARAPKDVDKGEPAADTP